jgi:RNA polymerase sigma-70 factor (ECF subfamily)
MNDTAKYRSRLRGKLAPRRRVDGLPAEISDEALLAACALGDRAALGALYDRLSPHLWRFLSRAAGDQLEELEDLVQATFIAVYTSAATFKGTALVRTWVFGIAANVRRRHVRDQVRRRAALERLSRLSALSSERPDESVEQQQLMLRMREALSALPHDLHVALRMCDLEDISGREAAAVLQIPEGTLYRRVHEARRALGALVEEGRS